VRAPGAGLLGACAVLDWAGLRWRHIGCVPSVRGACRTSRAAACAGGLILDHGSRGAARGTRPSGMTGCGQRPRETERAPDPKEINVPARNEQRIGRSQRHGLVRRPARRTPYLACPLGNLQSAPTRSDGCHTRPNRATIAPIPPGRPQPCRIQPSRGSTSGSGGRCWQSHQVPPGHSSWRCWRQDGQIMRPLSRAGTGQAAFALRIRRRRSAARSSSFSPPQVPYFSGRLTA
jgi:hypothetical protein